MAKRVSAVLKIQAEAGQANPASVGKDLGPHGINIMEFCRRYNETTEHQRGYVVPAVLTIYEDRSFDLVTKAPTTVALLRRAAGIDKGSPRPHAERVAAISREQLRDVAKVKLPDLNTDDLDAAEKIVAGTARSMGLTIKE